MALSFHLGAVRDHGEQQRLGDVLARHLAAADVLGRVQILRHAQKKVGRGLPLATASRPIQFGEQDDQATVGISFDLGGEDAAQRIRDLTPVTKQLFNGLTSQYRRDAFTLAGTSDLQLIKKIHDALATNAEEGGTAAEFKSAAAKLASEAGVDQLSAFTLDTAFQTAMQKAYSAGRLEQMREPHMLDALPYWQYWTVGDARVRPEHAALDGFCARAIDSVWRRIYPPVDYNCRCSVIPILPEDAPEGSDEGGMERLPLLARGLPHTGFHSLASI